MPKIRKGFFFWHWIICFQTVAYIFIQYINTCMQINWIISLYFLVFFLCVCFGCLIQILYCVCVCVCAWGCLVCNVLRNFAISLFRNFAIFFISLHGCWKNMTSKHTIKQQWLLQQKTNNNTFVYCFIVSTLCAKDK